MADEVTDPITGNYWPEGNYITCNPKWYPIDPIPMVGFRGWRYFEEPPSPISEEDHQNGYSTKGGLLDRDRYADLYGVVDRSYSMPEEFVLSNLRDRET